MPRYIDADALLERIDAIEPLNWTYSESEIQEVNDFKMYRGMVESSPTADVAEVKHSRWEKISGFDVCNICGTSPAYCEPEPNNPKGYPPYCHNCGAKMDLNK